MRNELSNAVRGCLRRVARHAATGYCALLAVALVGGILSGADETNHRHAVDGELHSHAHVHGGPHRHVLAARGADDDARPAVPDSRSPQPRDERDGEYVAAAGAPLTDRLARVAAPARPDEAAQGRPDTERRTIGSTPVRRAHPRGPPA